MRLFTLSSILLVFSTLSAVAQTDPINDTKQLTKTIQAFGEILMSSSQELPPSFLFNEDEFKALLKANDIAIGDDFEKRYKTALARVSGKYKEVKRDLGEINQMISFDTITYKQRNSPYLDASIVFRGVDKNTKKEEPRRVLISFAIYNGKLKVAGAMRSLSNLHYDLHKLETIHDTQRSRFFKLYRPVFFSSSITKVIPIQKKRKWGLVNLKGEEVLPPAYDSIFPFTSDFYRVRIKGRYNLLDKNFKPVFPKAKLNIRLENEHYLVSEQKGKYIPYPAIKEEVTIEESAPAITNKTPEGLLADSLNEQERRGQFRIERPYSPGNVTKHFVIDKPTHDTLSRFVGFDYIDPHGPFLNGLRNDTTFIMTPSGKVLAKIPYVCYYQSPGYVQVFDKETRLFGLYAPFTNTYIKPGYKYLQPIDRDRYFVVITKNGKMGYLDKNGKELF